MLTDEPSAGRLLPIVKSRLNHSRALDEGECTVLISISTELADAAPLLSGQIPLITQWSYFYKFDVENCMEGAMLGYLQFQCHCEWRDPERPVTLR